MTRFATETAENVVPTRLRAASFLKLDEVQSGRWAKGVVGVEGGVARRFAGGDEVGVENVGSEGEDEEDEEKGDEGGRGNVFFEGGKGQWGEGGKTQLGERDRGG